ncbi:MAG TPA: hypothetical protein VFS21_14650, partial [Roseiflexaceae bacterium]|nr:hypothetical protein [Roseiflexaceae bacterium]
MPDPARHDLPQRANAPGTLSQEMLSQEIPPRCFVRPFVSRFRCASMLLRLCFDAASHGAPICRVLTP